MDGVPGEAGAFPDEAAFLGEEGGHLATDEFVTHGFLAVRVQFVLVRQVPRARGGAVIVGHGFQRSRVFGLLGVEGVAVEILDGAEFAGAGGGVDLEDGVVGSVDVGVHAQTEEMLVVVGVDSRVHFGAPAVGVFAGVHGVGVEDAGEFDFELDGAVLVEDPVDAVFVVGGGEDVGDDEFARAGDDDGIVAEVGVFEEDAVVFLVDADGVFDGLGRARAVHKVKVHVVDAAFAVTPQGERVGHVAAAVFAQVEGVFALMRVFWVAVGDDHLGEGEAVEDGADFVLGLVEVGNVVEHDAFAVIEANVYGPILPLDDTVLHRKGHTLGLRDVDGFEVSSEAVGFVNRVDRVVVGWGFAEGPAHFGHVDVDDFLKVGVVDWAKVQGVGVLRVIDVWAVIHQGLLEADTVAESLVVADSPRVTIDLVHLLRGDANQPTLLDDTRVLAGNGLDNLEVFHGDQGLNVGSMFPFDEFALCEIDMAIVDLALGGDGHDIGNTMWFLSVFGVR